MTENKARSPSPSDRPPEDLKKERDAFIQQFFRKGAQLTEELLKENERLRTQITDLEQDNQKLRTHVASDDAIRDLLRKIAVLEEEKHQLVSRTNAIAARTDEFSIRHSEVENELADLANLYVATSQLHSAHSVRNVLRNLKELCAQLLGAAAFVIYVRSDDGKELVAVATEGVLTTEVARIPADRGPVAEAFVRGEVSFRRVDTAKGTPQEPAALIPLLIDGKSLGVIAVFRTLTQKTEFVHADEELFNVLRTQAAPALVNARLFTDAGRKIPGLGAFTDLED
jgi:hypothetical protein